jgi:hypothetical protein
MLLSMAMEEDRDIAIVVCCYRLKLSEFKTAIFASIISSSAGNGNTRLIYICIYRLAADHY